MSDRYCGKCGVQTATSEMEFEIGTAIGVSNGTDALKIALMSILIKLIMK